MAEIQRYTSIWDAVEDDPAAALSMKFKSALLALLQHEIERQQFETQTQIAEALGTSQPRVSDLMRGKLSKFSADNLIEYCSRLDMHLVPQLETT